MFTYPENSISREQDPTLYNCIPQKNNLKECLYSIASFMVEGILLLSYVYIL